MEGDAIDVARRPGLDTAIIVETATRMADEVGIDRVTLGAVATELGVKTPSLYNHIEGIEGLYQRMAVLGFRSLSQRLQRAAVGKEADRALTEMLRAYRQFAHERPGLYQITLRAPGEDDADMVQAATEIVETVLAVLEPYRFDAETAIHVVRGFRSVAHGFVSLEMAGGFAMPMDADESYQRLIQIFLRGLPDVTSPPADTGRP